MVATHLRLWLLMACFAAGHVSRATDAADSRGLEGLWVSETTFGPALQGELVVAHDGPWRATIKNTQSKCEAGSGILSCVFADGAGEFRGRLSGNQLVSGFWIQPPSGPTREDLGQAYATPLVLQTQRKNSWRSTVQPLDQRFTLYLKIFRNDQGELIGAFRNPEANSRGGTSVFRIAQQGDALRFRARPDPAQPEIGHDATLLRSPDRIQVRWPDLGRTIELARRAEKDAPDFFPRPPGEPAYAYRQPPDTGDGWQTANASAAGIDEAALTRMVQKIIEADPAAQRPSLIHSLLVARRGKLVLDEYFFGFGRETPHDTRSAGKTFASVLLGVAMKENPKLSPDARICDLLARRGPFDNPDPRKSRITLAQLLTHNSGLACDDNDDASPGNETTMQSQTAEPDWWRYTLNLPMAHDPGTRYAYCSANINLVGAALTTTTRMWLPELFERSVAQPLQFQAWYWNLMPTHEGYLGGGVFMRPRDLLKVGQAYLDGGTWKGRRVVEPSWVKLSTAPHATISPQTTGLDPDRFGEFYGAGEDGYAWHLGQIGPAEKPYRTYAAVGNGGQILLVVPDVELVVVFTGGNFGQGGIWSRWPKEIVGGEILSALRD